MNISSKNLYVFCEYTTQAALFSNDDQLSKSCAVNISRFMNCSSQFTRKILTTPRYSTSLAYSPDFSDFDFTEIFDDSKIWNKTDKSFHYVWIAVTVLLFVVLIREAKLCPAHGFKFP